MFNNAWEAVTNFFSGKGGVLKLAIAGSLGGALLYEAIDAKYNVSVKGKNGSVHLSPSDGKVPTEHSQEEPAEVEQG